MKEAEGGFHVFCPMLPGCHTQNETMEEDVENIREAIPLYIESLVEDGPAHSHGRHLNQTD
jgi:predicted RNase H-like HicB family nuclease